MNKKNTSIFIILCTLLLIECLFLQAVFAGEQRVLTLGYRAENKSPFMAAYPDNTGLYTDLYTQAAKMINCELEIIRKSKKRILNELEKGLLDFYPAFNFTEKRARHFYFIRSGLTKKNVGISRKALPEITDLSQLKGYRAILALGSINRYKHIKEIKVHHVPNLNLNRVVILLNIRRDDFYYSNYSEWLYYKKQHPLKTKFLKIHHHCCGGKKPVYLAFSRKSSKFIERSNPDFNKNLPLSPDNFPVIPEPDSIAHQFAIALQRMEKEGITQKIYDQYFK